MPDARYRRAFADWLACAARGRGEPAAQAARGLGADLGGRIAAAGCAGHVLDYDDTYAPGLVHASAPVAPLALLLAADLDQSMEAALAAYAAGFEATAALARASHPGLYERGWHPTAVCGAVGAAVTASRLLGLEVERERAAAALAVLRAAGLQAAFGTDGKALQVGLAAAAGLAAARLAAAGAHVDAGAVGAGFEAAYGGSWALSQDEPAIGENWIKAHPCCLMTHSAIDAAEALRARDAVPEKSIVVTVHPTARRGAPHDDAATGLQAKFSIPYTVAHTLLRGPPTVESFTTPDPAARSHAARRVRVRIDAALLETEARIEVDDVTVARVEHARGSPQRPMDDAALAHKAEQLGPGLGAFDGDAPAADVAAGAGL